MSLLLSNQNDYTKHLMRTTWKEEVDLSEYVDFVDARNQICRFIEDVYNYKHIHSSLGYLTPAEFKTDWLAAQTEPDTP